MNAEKTTITRKLYYEDAYLTSFRAKVLSCEPSDSNLFCVVLDQTAFFPEGGGQKSDTGRIGEVSVTDVQMEKEIIYHFTSSPLPVGESFDCEIDWENRFLKMQLHSAEHLLCGLIHNAKGYENVGFHLSDADALVTLDVDGPLTEEEMSSFEKEANLAVSKNLPIQTSFPSSCELPSLSYRSKLEMTENVRLVTIEGIDVCACCAPHVASTAEIGLVKIIDAMPHRGGMRIFLKAGLAAYEDYRLLADETVSAQAILSAKRYEVADKLALLDEKNKKLSFELTEIKKKMTLLFAKSMKEELMHRPADDPSPFLFFPEDLDDVQVRNLVNECTTSCNGIVAAFIKTNDGYRYIISRKEEDDSLPALAKDLSARFAGRGGGSKKMIQGSLSASEEEIRAFLS